MGIPRGSFAPDHRSHCLGLIDRAEKCPPHRRIMEGRMQIVEAQDAHGCRILGNHGDIAVAGERLELIGWRNLEVDPENETAG